LTYDPDVDGDNNIGITDLLALLSLFSENDLDDDGIWDSVDDCVGQYDECGVCNGVGIPEGYCTCTLLIDALGDCGGNCALDVDEDGVCDEYYGPCYGQASVTFDDYTYDLIAIGNQCWFAENLRTEHYTNGDAIPTNLTSAEWSSTSAGAAANYGEGENCWLNSNDGTSNSPDGDACDPVWSLEEYGRLYNWYAVEDERGLCPSGWHVPTDGEWMTLEMELGMSESQANGTGWRGTDEGTQMKTTHGWAWEGHGNNSSGFSGLPGGLVFTDGEVGSAGDGGYWWSSSLATGSNAWSRHLNWDDENVLRFSWGGGNYGFSVRCLKDAE
jgi:uncharacterized protein (TIGR02145 family)